MMAGAFVKLSTELRDLEVIARLKGAPLAVWIALGLHVGKNKRCWPSVTTLARITGYSRRWVLESLKRLEAEGLIGIESRATERAVNLYTMNGDFITYGRGKMATKPRASDSESRAMYKALVDAYRLDPEAEEDKRGFLNSFSKEILELGEGYTPEEVRTVGDRHWQYSDNGRPPRKDDFLGELNNLRFSREVRTLGLERARQNAEARIERTRARLGLS